MPSSAFTSARLLVSLLICAWLVVAPGARAQNAPAKPETQAPPAATPADDSEDIVRINAELWQTDVMVFDSGGKFVEGLTPEQFELRVDGRAQPISFFEPVRAGAIDEDAQLAAARGGMGPRPTTSRPGATVPLDRGRTIFFFVDDLHLAAEDAFRTRRTLLRFISDEMRQNDAAAIMSASGQVGFLQQLTGNKAALRAAVARLTARPTSVRDGERPPMSEVQALAIERRDQRVLDFFVDEVLRDNPGMRSREAAEQQVMTRARAIITLSNEVSERTLRTLEHVIRTSSALPGRKILFFISDGFPLDLRGDATQYLRAVTDAAARAGVVIYSLGAQGLSSGLPDASGERAFDPGGRLAAVDASELSSMQEPLFTLAGDTGGRALVNTNEFGPAVNKALQETSRYYLLAWHPEGIEGRAGAKFHRIEVSIRNRPDLKVAVRRGFFDAPPVAKSGGGKKAREADAKKGGEAATDAPPSVAVADRELLKAMQALYPRSALPVSLTLGYTYESGSDAALRASYELSRDALRLLKGAGAPGEALLDVALAIFNDRGTPVTSLREGLRIPPGLLARPDPPHVLQSHALNLKPGLYQARVAVRDRQTGRTGSAMEWVEIPERKAGQLSLGSIFLGERTTTADPETLKQETLGEGVALSVERRFARTSWLRFVTYIYDARPATNGAPDLTIQVQIFRDDQPVLTAPLRKVSSEGVADLSRIPYAAELSLASFPPGRYILQLTAIDRAAKTSSSQRVNFTIDGGQ